MGFANDIPDYDKLEDSRSYLYRTMPNEFWTELLRLIDNAGFSRSELRSYINSVSHILQIVVSPGWGEAELIDDIIRAVKTMEHYVSEGRMDILMDCLSCLMGLGKITEDEINELLQMNQVGYEHKEGMWNVMRAAIEVNKKPSKIFISHAYSDLEFIERFVQLLEFIGVGKEQIFCSSVSGYDVPEGKDIYQHLQEQFEKFDLHIFYMLSDNYYKSAAALNEMGAAWILKMHYTTILLPGFEYKEIKGAVNPYIISAKLDADRYQVRDKLKQIKEKLEREFDLMPKAEARWDKEVDRFIEDITNIATNE